MKSEYIHIYNNLINLTRNKNLYFYFTSKDTFSDRIIIFMLHLAFFLKTYKLNTDKKYLQHSIINKIDAWENLSFDKKGDILKNYLDVKENSKKFIEYFDNYNKYLSNLSLNSFTKSVIDHKF